MRSPLDALVTRHSLVVLDARSPEITFDDPDLADPDVNLCAKVPLSISQDIDVICNLLSVSKRRFLRATFLEAIDKAWEVISREAVSYTHLDVYKRQGL